MRDVLSVAHEAGCNNLVVGVDDNFLVGNVEGD